MNKASYLAILALSVVLLASCSGKEKAREVMPVKVKTEKAEPVPVSGSQEFSGTVEASDDAALSFASGGTVTKVYVSVGDMVKKGALIAEVDPVSVRNAYNAAKAVREQAEDAFRRMKQLHDEGSLTEMQWIEVQSKLRQAVSTENIARKSLTDCHLYAPYSGYVAEKLVEAGQNAAPGMPVIKMVSINKVKIKIAVPEDEMSGIKVGQSALVRVPALQNMSCSGRVAEKGVAADPLSRSYEVKIEVSNSGHKLLPGMVCEAYVGDNLSAMAVALPANVILIDTDNRTFVWTAVGGKAHKTYVEVGESVGSRVVINSGISAGDKVIVGGQQKVSEGIKIAEL